MIVRFPDHYFDFECTGGPCPDNCCIGDELVLDEDTWNYYQTVEGDFGDHLREVLKDAGPSEDESGRVYCLDVNGRCPFLREDNYCEIVLALGQSALGEVCATYPRSEDCLGNDVEMNLILSCPEAARLLLTKKAVTHFEEANAAEEEFIPNEDYEETDDLFFTADAIKDIRSELITLLQDRSLPLRTRVENALARANAKSLSDPVSGSTISDPMPEPEASDTKCPMLPKEKSSSRSKTLDSEKSCPINSLLKEDADGIKERLTMLEGLPWQTVLWKNDADALNTLFDSEDNCRRALELTGDVAAKLGIDTETALEQLLVYYLFRYLPWAMDDGDLTGKLRMGLLSCLIIRDLMLKNALENDGRLTLSCLIRAVNSWSKVLEYADDNLLYIFEKMSEL